LANKNEVLSGEIMEHVITYDEKFDILRIREVGKGNFDYCVESQNGGYIHEFIDIESGELKGFEIWDFMKHLNANK